VEESVDELIRKLEGKGKKIKILDASAGGPVTGEDGI
jgi:hypothetical protein